MTKRTPPVKMHIVVKDPKKTLTSPPTACGNAKVEKKWDIGVPVEGSPDLCATTTWSIPTSHMMPLKVETTHIPTNFEWMSSMWWVKVVMAAEPKEPTVVAMSESQADAALRRWNWCLSRAGPVKPRIMRPRWRVCAAAAMVWAATMAAI